MSINNSDGGGVFINGKEQVMELLRSMDGDSRTLLLDNMRKRNAFLTDELARATLSFDEVKNLSDSHLKFIMGRSGAPIVGLALKGCSKEFQQRALKLLDRSDAVEAFNTMSSPLENERVNCQKAQNKILAIMKAVNIGH